MASQGFIKIHRKMLDWEWYQDANTFRVFFHLILISSHKDVKHKGVDIKRGQCLTTYSELGDFLKLSARQVRYSISSLEMTHELSHEKVANKSLITVLNYDLYQGDLSDKLRTNCQRSVTHPKNKNVKNYPPYSPPMGDAPKANPQKFKKPTPAEVDEYAKEKGLLVDGQEFCDFYESKNWYVGKNKMVDWKAAARNWHRREQKKKPKEGKTEWNMLA